MTSLYRPRPGPVRWSGVISLRWRRPMYQIIAVRRSDDVKDQAKPYQVAADEVVTSLPAPTRSFAVARDRYCELTGEDPRSIDYVHAYEIDGVAQEPL